MDKMSYIMHNRFTGLTVQPINLLVYPVPTASTFSSGTLTLMGENLFVLTRCAGYGPLTTYHLSWGKGCCQSLINEISLDYETRCLDSQVSV